MSVNMNSGPTVAELKEQFKSRSIPLESDFSDLIDIADYGRKAVGLSPQQSPNQSCGLALDNEGQLEVKIKSNGKLLKNSAGISIVTDQQFYTGMIMMFSGSSAPTGWRLCNGSYGTPDLRKRFILGGEFNDSGKSSAKTGGSGNSKTRNVTTVSDTSNIKVSSSSHRLTESQMPAHKHANGMVMHGTLANHAARFGTYNTSQRERASEISYGNSSNNRMCYTQTKGGGASHSHAVSVTQDTHSHSVNVIPPYYTLAFIMKT